MPFRISRLARVYFLETLVQASNLVPRAFCHIGTETKGPGDEIAAQGYAFCDFGPRQSIFGNSFVETKNFGDCVSRGCENWAILSRKLQLMALLM